MNIIRHCPVCEAPIIGYNVRPDLARKEADRAMLVHIAGAHGDEYHKQFIQEMKQDERKE